MIFFEPMYHGLEFMLCFFIIFWSRVQRIVRVCRQRTPFPNIVRKRGVTQSLLINSLTI